MLLATFPILIANIADNKAVQTLVKMESKFVTAAEHRTKARGNSPSCCKLRLVPAAEPHLTNLQTELEGLPALSGSLGMLGSFSDSQLLFLRPVICPSSLDNFSCSFYPNGILTILLGGGLQREGGGR